MTQPARRRGCKAPMTAPSPCARAACAPLRRNIRWAGGHRPPWISGKSLVSYGWKPPKHSERRSFWVQRCPWSCHTWGDIVHPFTDELSLLTLPAISALQPSRHRPKSRPHRLETPPKGETPVIHSHSPLYRRDVSLLPRLYCQDWVFSVQWRI